MSNNRPISQRQDSLLFIQGIVKRGGPKSIWEGQRYAAIVHSYPLELWYLCWELNQDYYRNGIKKLVEERIEKINASLN